MKKGLILLLLSLTLHTVAQKNTNIWHFGAKAGLDFNTTQSFTSSNLGVIDNVPKPITGFFTTSEGCFSLSDKLSGELMMSSDGSTIYNKSGAIMTNGSGLLGNSSSTSSGIVVPFPGNRNLYYVFTVSDVTAARNGINYSIVDMTLNSGLGGVDPAKKNINLSLGTSGYTKADVAENIAAIQHTNGTDYWLVSRFRNVILVWQISSSGVSEPTVYTTGHSVGVHPYPTGGGIGYLKFNSDGSKFLFFDHLYVAGTKSWLTIADFDRSTGTVSNIKERTATEFGSPYALEFSISGEYVYVTTVEYGSANGLYLAKVSDIENLSAATIPVTKLANDISCVQMGADGRIYGIAYNSRNLYIVLNPDSGNGEVALLANYLLSGTAGRYGLPVFAVSFFKSEPVQSKEIICAGISNTYKITVSLGGIARLATLKWNFGDGTIITETLPAGSASGTYSYNHTYASTGNYTVSVIPGIDDGDGIIYEDADKVSEKTFDVVDCSIISNRMIRRDVKRD